MRGSQRRVVFRHAAHYSLACGAARHARGAGAGDRLRLLEHVALAPLTTLGLGGAARFLAEVGSEPEAAEAAGWAAQRGLPL
ncbi:MAG: hypothetical protein MUF10_13900, partial [Thermoanaerobaculaceae bacterium]|nr:hypothetical protein [Thermoanaerobaculaceae bacterium]